MTTEDERAAFFALMERANRVGALLPERIEHIDIDDPVVLAELRVVMAEFNATCEALLGFKKPSSTGCRSFFWGARLPFFFGFRRLSMITSDIDPAGSPNSSQQMPSPASPGRIWL
ncbi:hypothetical protein [Bradyrhizobium sp. MOS002]|uniref:hypothetical protein n=1 Tax=Bradyrhizobium sp. MOS002 TaxID=2133947 RepID=UPI001304FD95|nr:hypothetical protein [Bradyrhizobium sp. MOS002]